MPGQMNRKTGRWDLSQIENVLASLPFVFFLLVSRLGKQANERENEGDAKCDAELGKTHRQHTDTEPSLSKVRPVSTHTHNWHWGWSNWIGSNPRWRLLLHAQGSLGKGKKGGSGGAVWHHYTGGRSLFPINAHTHSPELICQPSRFSFPSLSDFSSRCPLCLWMFAFP